jgi:putative oxidoreductase
MQTLSLEKFLLSHMAILAKLGRFQGTGLLLMRVGIGVMMFMHGYSKMWEGPKRWTSLGGNMKHFGINFYPEIWGFMAALSETLGAVFIVIGFFFRPSCFLLLCTMIVASVAVMSKNPFMDASESIELAFVFLGLFILGPGKYSVDKS